MELKIDVMGLKRMLKRSQGIVEKKKSTTPILSYVLLEARKGDELHLSATDLDITVSSEHRCEVLNEGALAVEAKQFYELVRGLKCTSGLTVTLKRASNNYLKLKSGASEFRIVGLPAEDFPALPRFEKVSFLSLDAGVLLDLIEKTSYAVSNDETRYNLNGVFFEPEPGLIRMVATDGHRLALSETPIEGELRLKKGVILPKKGLYELRKLLAEVTSGGEENPKGDLGFAENSAIFRRPGVLLVMRLIEGLFPDYRQVIPKAGEKLLTLGRVRFLDALRRASLLSSDKAHAVKLELAKGLLTVLSQNPDLGEAKEELPVDYQGESLKIGFNAHYLMDVLQVLTTDDVILELADDLSPCVVKPAGQQNTTAMVMPMRI